jgi:hypothetical protein
MCVEKGEKMKPIEQIIIGEDFDIYRLGKEVTGKGKVESINWPGIVGESGQSWFQILFSGGHETLISSRFVSSVHYGPNNK